jgi:hypothetical protein
MILLVNLFIRQYDERISRLHDEVAGEVAAEQQ